MLGTILIVILILMLVGAMPTWGHSRNWGFQVAQLLREKPGFKDVVI